MQSHSHVLKHHTTMSLEKLHGLLAQSNRKSPFSYKIEKILGQALQGEVSKMKIQSAEKKEFVLKHQPRKKGQASQGHFHKEVAFHLISEAFDETVSPPKDEKEVLKVIYSDCICFKTLKHLHIRKYLKSSELEHIKLQRLI